MSEVEIDLLKKIIRRITIIIFACRILSIPDASHINNTDLQIFKKHKLKELRVNYLKPSIDELIDALNEWTRNNLERLSVSNAKFPTVGG